MSYKETKGWCESGSSYVQIKEEAAAPDEAEALEATGSDTGPNCRRRQFAQLQQIRHLLFSACIPPGMFLPQEAIWRRSVRCLLNAINAKAGDVSCCRLLDFDVHDKKGTQQTLDGGDLKARPLFLTGAAGSDMPPVIRMSSLIAGNV